ncbi:MAG: efflux RND transporter periplasmic adaptor subunit [Sphingobacteriales bacterium]|nr:MAG: efflux RND transporter periplasmic adaptor subunit [Sphingobacteriales bacterium]
MKRIFQILTVAIFLASASCGSKKMEPVTESTEAHPEERESTIVSLTDAQLKTVAVEMGSVEQKNITATVKVNGTLEVPPQNKAYVTSLYSGVLRSILIHPGAPVRKGQVLATVVNTELSGIQQQLITVNASLRLAELEQARQQELVAGNAAPLKNLQRAQAELSSLRAQRSALQRQLSDLGISAASVSTGSISSTLSIRAPISGTISDINAQIGSKVDAATPLAQIVNNSQLHLDLFVYEKDLPVIRIGQIIHFTLTNNPGKEYDAKIFSVGTAFANETKAVPVHAEVMGEKAGLIEGMGVTAIISIGTQTAPAVPNEAIVTSGGKDYIFIRTNKQVEAHHDEEAGEGHPESHEAVSAHHFERIEIARGVSELGYTVITPVQELPDNVQIVTKGAFFLMAKMTNTGKHEH